MLNWVIFLESAQFPVFLNMEETDNTVSSELLALTYGAFVSQIVKDYEEVSEINKQIEQLGLDFVYRMTVRYNIGIRLIEEYLAKTRTRGIRSFMHACESIATKGFSMYLGVEATLENWNEDEQSCAIRTWFRSEFKYRFHFQSTDSIC